MWHEARKQEKKIRGMLVDYKRRAERRKEYYERIKQDPTQFIQIHGRSCKIHLDPAIHNAAEAPGSMMPWRGDMESMIDRFDVRAHLDDIPSFDRTLVETLTKEQLWEERQANYERYRILVQNEFLGVKEEKFLNQIRLEELYGPVGNKSIEEEKRALMPRKAAIGFIYGEPSGGEPAQGWPQGPPPTAEEADEDSADDSDSDIDLDLTVDVLSLTNQQQHELNLSGIEYGLNPEDFMNLMSRDLEEAEALRIAKEHEDEKAMYSGRKSRKERRALKKKHLDRKLSPPSYAARSSPTYGPYHRLSSKSHSKSPSPPCGTSQIKFITTFGEESEGLHSEGEGGVILIPEGGGGSRASASDRRKSSATSSSSRSSARRSKHSRRSSTCSRERSQSRTAPHRRQSSSKRSRTRSPPRGSRRDRHGGRYRRRSSRSYSKSRSRSIDRERSRKRRHGKSGSRSYSRSRSRSRSRSKSSSYRKDQQRASPKVRKSCQGHPDPLLEGGSSPPNLPSPPRRRYYGRRPENSESEEAESAGEEGGGARNNGSPMSHPVEESSWSMNSLSAPSSFGNESTVDKNSSSSSGAKLTPQERLKKKMQALLKKQYKADKKLEKERAVKAEQERQDREEELREIAIKLRKREREKRHRLHGEDSNSEDSARSRSPSKSPPPPVPTRSRAEGRHRERDATYDRGETLDKEESRSRPPKERGREREAGREPDLKKYSHRSRSRERERHKDRGRERYKSKEWSSEREPPRRTREEGVERHREDSYREREAGRMRSHPLSTRSYGVGSYGLPREERPPHPKIWDNPPMQRQSEDYLTSAENRKIRLVDY